MKMNWRLKCKCSGPRKSKDRESSARRRFKTQIMRHPQKILVLLLPICRFQIKRGLQLHSTRSSSYRMQQQALCSTHRLRGSTSTSSPTPTTAWSVCKLKRLWASLWLELQHKQSLPRNDTSSTGTTHQGISTSSTLMPSKWVAPQNRMLVETWGLSGLKMAIPTKLACSTNPK